MSCLISPPWGDPSVRDVERRNTTDASKHPEFQTERVEKRPLNSVAKRRETVVVMEATISAVPSLHATSGCVYLLGGRQETLDDNRNKYLLVPRSISN